MDMTPGVGLPEAAWHRVTSAPKRLLVLDYDGTLAPFQVQRDQARMPPATMQALERIVGSPGTRVVILSGRPTAEMATLLAPLECTLIGEHGWERREPGGHVRFVSLPDAARERLEQAERDADDLGFRRLLERKRTALVMHVRGLEDGKAHAILRACRRAWYARASDGILRLVETDGGTEIRAVGRDKGSAVRELLAEEPTTTAVVYAGDDATDEDAFAVLRGRGIGILVAAAERPSLAETRLASPLQVGAMLEEWERRTGAASGTSR